MPSGIYTTIRLDPFYQEFLRSHFNQDEAVFTFPKNHDLVLRLERYLSLPPATGYKPISFGEETFRIEIPYMEMKNPSSYFYLSEKKMQLFQVRIRDFFREIFHEEMRKHRARNFTKSEAIICFMDDYHISPRFEDRLLKAYNRYMDIERHRRYRRQRIKKSLSV